VEPTIAIVGAGVAGLAAASELRRHGVAVVVYEAALRIGGRIFTRHDPQLPVPVELGAEFVHGEAPETMRIAREARLLVADIPCESWTASSGRLRRESPMPAVDRTLDKISPGGPDESLTEFLARRRSPQARRDRAPVVEFVSGFYAADPARIGVQSLAPEPGEPASAPATRLARMVGGYHALARWLARDLGDDLHLGTAVRAIEWRTRDVTLALETRSGPRRIRATAAIVTLPLGVLQRPASNPAGVRIDPDPPGIRAALARLAMGAATKLVIAFRDDLPWTPVAARQGEDARRLALLRVAGAEFSTWWSMAPFHWPAAVAWSGGPTAEALARRLPVERLATALRGLAGALDRPAETLVRQVLAWWTHDWSGDPLAAGAYSYARVGGADAGLALARPVDRTLYFAGEAASENPGTVEGAIASGRRAARQVIDSL
jgi:monoamine oxidase